MPSNVQPSVFIAHGTPMLALADSSDDPFARSLRTFAKTLPRPRAIVIVSAHSTEEETVQVQAASQLHAVHDFGGFPKDLYEVKYACPGDPDLAVKIVGLLSQAGMKAMLHADGGLDHGAWIPLMHLYPEGDVPVVQVTLPYPGMAHSVLKLGKSLADLRRDGVLLIGSGGVVHNLADLQWHGKHGLPDRRAVAFETWVQERLEKADVEALLDFEAQAPDPTWAHSTSEHFYPIFFTLGASLYGDKYQPFFHGVQYSSLSMLSFALS